MQNILKRIQKSYKNNHCAHLCTLNLAYEYMLKPFNKHLIGFNFEQFKIENSEHRPLIMICTANLLKFQNCIYNNVKLFKSEEDCLIEAFIKIDKQLR